MGPGRAHLINLITVYMDQPRGMPQQAPNALFLGANPACMHPGWQVA